MTMERLELLATRAAEGLASQAELDELARAMEEQEEDGLLREALSIEAGAVDVADLVMAALPPEEAWLSAFADGQLDGERRERIAARVRTDAAARDTVAAFAQVSVGLSEAMASARGPTPQVWPAVARALGLDPEQVPGWDETLLREAVLAEAGRVDVIPGVLASVRPAAAARPAAVELPLWRRLVQSFSLPALGLATAAALLLSFPAYSPDAQGPVSFRVAPVNHVEIEDISTDQQDAMVQVLQFDEDAPTIIFIEEIPAGDEGATL